MIVKDPTIKKKHRILKKFGLFLAINLLLLIFVLFGAMLFIRKKLETLPIIDTQYLTTYGTSKILDENGTVIWQPFDKLVLPLSYDEIPEFYKTALLEIEDREFFESPGISIRGMTNMVYSVLRSKIDKSYIPRGGSTIEQQLIKNKFYDGGAATDTKTRKIQELFLALQLDENFSKEEILTFYVNDLEFANRAFGIGAAMQSYFGKTSKDYKNRTPETISELAYLAGLGKAPTRYNLFEHPEAAESRKAVVLKILADREKITLEEYWQALLTPLIPQPVTKWRDEIREQNQKYKMYTDGVREEIKSLGYNLEDTSLTIQTFLNTDIYEQIETLVRNPDYYLDDNQQASVAVIRNDGVVTALVGARDPSDEFNRALSKNRSSGSSMKPFTAYCPLLEYFGESYTTTSKFDTSNYQYPGSSAVMHNFGGAENGMQTMWNCLKFSYNTPVARIDDEILGSDRMRTFLSGLGLDNKPVDEVYSSVDGIGLFISPLQSAAAYNALNNGGIYTKPRFVDRITFTDGSVREIKPESHPAMRESVAYAITKILQDIPGNTAKKGGIPEYTGYAGKTGSVGFAADSPAPMPYGDGNSDEWYCSYTNGGYAVSVWCGYDIPDESPRLPDAYRGQQEIGRDIQKLLNGDREVPDFTQPDTVRKESGQEYQILDEREETEKSLDWPDVSDITKCDVEKIKSAHPDVIGWAEMETGFWYEYYKENGDSLPTVIDQSLYEHLRPEVEP